MYQIDKNLSNRINILKFISIVMVVWVHSYFMGSNNLDIGVNDSKWLSAIQYIISQSVSRAAVPLFFLISGFLLYSKDFTWLNNFKKKSRTILLPYLIWNTFWIIFYLIAQSISYISPYFSNQEYYVQNFGVLKWIKAYTYFKDNSPFLYTLWFLRDLFILNIIAVIIKKIVDKIPIIILILLSIIWLSGIIIPYADSQSFVFFILGYYIVKYNLNIGIIDKLNWYIITFTYALFIALDYLFSDSFITIHRVCVLIGILFFIKLTKVLLDLKSGNIFLRLSKYAFIIYVFHEMNLSIVRKVAFKVFPQTSIMQLVEYMLLPIIIITGCIIFGMLFKKFAPKIYSISTGSR